MTLEELFTLENLNNAFYKSSRLSYWKESTQRYNANLLINNIKLQKDLLNREYRISDTNNFSIHERGRLRNIEAPPQRDRIVQKVLCEKVLIPQISKYLIYDNYASLKDRGTAFARKRIDIILRRYLNEYGENGYILKIDIKKYFENIDHNILKMMIREKITASEEVLDLIDYIIDTSSDSDKGLNLGAEAPQILAVYYLSPVDNLVKTVKGTKGCYGRYMDDIFIISNSKEELKKILNEIQEQLSLLKLEINYKKTSIIKLTHGFTLLQIRYSIINNKIIKRPTHDKIARERRRIKKYKRLCDLGLMSEIDAYNSYKSWRNALKKDCNRCYKSIQSLDRLFNSLFRVSPKTKLNRNDLINSIIRKEKDYETYSTYGRRRLCGIARTYSG